jgi:hypothetical protein
MGLVRAVIGARAHGTAALAGLMPLSCGDLWWQGLRYCGAQAFVFKQISKVFDYAMRRFESSRPSQLLRT